MRSANASRAETVHHELVPCAGADTAGSAGVLGLKTKGVYWEVTGRGQSCEGQLKRGNSAAAVRGQCGA